MAIDRHRLIQGMLQHYPFVIKNFRAYFQNLYRRNILKTSVVTPFSAIFYATHKCNLDCSYCTQKNPEVFSEELDTESTIRLFHNLRKDVDTLVITGGECTIRPDIEELVRAAREEFLHARIDLPAELAFEQGIVRMWIVWPGPDPVAPPIQIVPELFSCLLLEKTHQSPSDRRYRAPQLSRRIRFTPWREQVRKLHQERSVAVFPPLSDLLQRFPRFRSISRDSVEEQRDRCVFRRRTRIG